MTEALICPYCASVDTRFKEKAGQWECHDCEKRFDAPDAKSWRAQRIFLSYGHDDNTPLVFALQERLESAGHIVWIDQTQIKAGDDWRLAIKKGLLESDRVLSFLSKHSTRDPGVCLDEIGIALAHRHGAIATLLVEPVEQVQPPPSLSHIQYLNLANWKQERNAGEPHWGQWLDAQAAVIVDIIGRNAGFAGDMDELQRLLKPQIHSGRLGNLVERGFCGRDWLFDEISAWRSRQPERTFWLVADPGMGKSAIAARLAHTTAHYTVAYHFCRFDEPGTRSPHTFVCNLAFQLAARLPGYRQLLLYATRYPSKPLAELNSDDLFSLLLADPLRLAIDGGQRDDRLLVIVDALDEAPAIADLLARRQGDFPAWVALLLTSRPDVQIQSALAGVFPNHLGNDDPRNMADLESFVTQWFDSTYPTPPVHAQKALLKNSEGNMLYLATAREGAKAGVFDLNKTDAYPKGLGALYRSWFDRKFGPDGDTGGNWSSSYALLELVCASPEPLPLTLARQTLSWVGQDRILASRPLGSLIQEQDNTIETFHRSLAEWLQDPVMSDRYWVNVQDGRVRLAKTLWSGLEDAINAKNAGYAHRVLPGLLLTIPAERRREVWGQGERRFELIYLLDAALNRFQEHKIRLARLELARLLAEESESHFGSESKPYLRALSELAKLLQEVTSNFAEAKNIFERVIAVREKVLGRDHPDTASGLNNLAGLLDTLGDYEAAQPLYERALSIREEVLGHSHYETAHTMADLGGLFQSISRFEEAQTLYRNALEIYQNTLGERSHHTILCMTYLAGIHEEKGDYEVSEGIFRQALILNRSILNSSDPDLASSIGYVGWSLASRGDYEAAEDYYLEALKIQENVLGLDHPFTSRTFTYLGDLKTRQKKFKEAEFLYDKALKIRLKIFGNNHPNTVRTTMSVAWIKEIYGEHQVAGEHYSNAFTIFRTICGPDHPDTLNAMNHLSRWVLRNKKNYSKAKTLLEISQEAHERTLGKYHPYTLRTLAFSAELLLALGNVEEATSLMSLVKIKREIILGIEHPDTILTQQSLAWIDENRIDLYSNPSHWQHLPNPNSLRLVVR